MTDKEKYIMGRAEFLADTEGCSLTEATKIAEKEYEEGPKNGKDKVINGVKKKTSR